VYQKCIYKANIYNIKEITLPSPETNFWKTVKKNLVGFKWVRLESWATKGVPDLMGFTETGDILTIELKVAKGNKVLLSPHQIAFHVEHQNSPCFILVKRAFDKAPRKSEVYLYTASQVRQISEQGLAVLPIYHSLSPIDWSGVRDALLATLA
tara:strand:- start:3797 stop:4255 length:459 start_codon:yes stop_codon:yes gene_type:complete